MTMPEAVSDRGWKGDSPGHRPWRHPGPLLRRLSAGGWLARVAVLCTLALPVAVLYGRTLAEMLVGLTGLLFLAESALNRQWRWLRSPWAALSLALWVWIMLCTVLFGTAHSIGESIVVVRFFIFAAALEHWVLRSEPIRRQLGYVAIAVAALVLVECWQQYLTGTNMLGYPAWSGHQLTGPFMLPRAGGTLQVMFLPGVMPVALLLLANQRLAWRAAGTLLILLGLITEILIGQSMPLLLMTFGIVIACLLLPSLRRPLLICLAGGVVFLAIGQFVAPGTNHRLIVRFSTLLEHFPQSPYGLLFSRAVAIVQAHPWTGMGYDGFRDHCMDPAILRGSSWLPAPDPSYGLKMGWLMPGNASDRAGCSIHPHNYYLEIATSAGVPGLVLFALMGLSVLWQTGRAAILAWSPFTVAMFASVCVIFWPIASTTSLFAPPNAAEAFLTIGWALATARWALHQRRLARFTATPAGASQGASPVAGTQDRASFTRPANKA